MKPGGKNIILTGAASGIGRALLELLAQFPAKIFAVDKDLERLERLPAGPATIIPYACDLGQPAAVDELFAEALRRLGTIDLFIANAGFAYYEKIAAPDWAHIEQIYRVNVFSPLYALEKMQQVNAGRPHKTVITASAMSFLGVPGYALYSSTKAALDRFAEAYRFELNDPRQLMMVYPIGTRTNFFSAATQAHAAPQTWPSQSAAQVALAILNGIQRDRLAVFPFPAFRVVLALPPLVWAEKAIEAWRLKKWLKVV